jgi:hypothetical protein
LIFPNYLIFEIELFLECLEKNSVHLQYYFLILEIIPVDEGFLTLLRDSLHTRRPIERQNTEIDVKATEVMLLENLLVSSQSTIAVELKVLLFNGAEMGIHSRRILKRMPILYP